MSIGAGRPLLVAAFVAALIGCSNSPPRIEQIELHVVHLFDADGVPAPPRLMVFVDVSDLDGEGEIAAMELRSTDPPYVGNSMTPRFSRGAVTVNRGTAAPTCSCPAV